MLSQSMKDEFIHEVILPGVSGLLNSPIDIILYDTDCNVIATSDMNAHNFGLTSRDEAKGMSYRDVSVQLVKSACTINDDRDISKILELCHDIHRIQQIVIKNKLTISYLDVIPYNNIFEASLVTNFPIIHPSGEVVALQSIASKFQLFGIYDYLKQLSQMAEDRAFKICKGHQLPIKLTKREHEVLFILMAGISQLETAQILNITRGTVSKILTDSLCPKFGLHGSNTKLLIEKAQLLGFGKYMPESLYQPRIIILDSEVKEKYFSAYE